MGGRFKLGWHITLGRGARNRRISDRYWGIVVRILLWNWGEKAKSVISWCGYSAPAVGQGKVRTQGSGPKTNPSTVKIQEARRVEEGLRTYSKGTEIARKGPGTWKLQTELRVWSRNLVKKQSKDKKSGNKGVFGRRHDHQPG